MKFQHRMFNVAVTVIVVLLVASCGGAEQRKAKYLERGKEYIAQENYDKAIVELKNVIQIDPKHAEAYYLVGQAEEKKQNMRQAFGNYSKAAELNPGYIEPRYRLGYIYFATGQDDKASSMADEILKIQPNNPSGKTLHAALMARKGDTKGAAREMEKVVAEAPTQLDAVDLLASIYAKEGSFDKAMEVLSKGVEANPKNIPLRAQYARMLAERKDFPKAEKALQEIIALLPEKLEPRLSLALFYSQTNQADKAEKTLREAIQANPDDGLRYIVLADFMIGQKKPDRAKEELIAAIKAKPKLGNVRLALAKLYEQTGEYDKATQVYRDLIEASGDKPDGLTARNRLSNLMMNEGKQEEAAKLVDEVLKENPQDSEALYIKGKLALAKRDAPSAIAAFRSVLRDQPNFVDAYLSLAEAQMLDKNKDLARENLQKAVELNPKSVRAHVALAKYFADAGDFGEALKKADDALKISPDDIDALGTKVDILQARKDTKGAQTVLEKIKKAHPDKAIGYYALGQLYLSQKKYDGAIHEFEQAMGKSKDISMPLTMIVATNLAQHKPEKAIDRLNDVIKQFPKYPVAHELLGEVYLSGKKYDEAEQSLRKAIEANPKWNVPYKILGNVYLTKGDVAKAGQAYQQGLGAIPEDAELQTLLAGFYERTASYDKAIEIYEKIFSKNSADDLVANNLAALLTDYRQDPQSLKRAKELAIRFESSQQPAFMDTLGWVYYKSGENDKAIPLLEKAVKRAPEVPVFRYHLGMVYYKKGDLQSAKTQLAKAVESKNAYPGLEEARGTLKQIP